MKIKILDVCWHIGHQYEMLKFPFADWYWLAQYRRPFTPGVRGRLEGRFVSVPYYEPETYDVAILHLDQECVLPHEWENGKGSIYRDMNEVICDIPKIVIMHGSPHAPEFLPAAELIDAVRRVTAGNYMVVNSRRAAEQWGWGTPIIHGMDSEEWWDLPKQPRVITVLSREGMPSYYDRPFLEAVREDLLRRDIIHCQIKRDCVPRSWDSYREFLGSSLLYLNPTAESPMPRARTEAMLSGCCVLTTPYHDADSFIEHGVNGYLIRREPAEVADLIERLLHSPAEASAIGRAGRDTARRLLDWNRYAGQWREYLEYVLADFAARRRASIAGAQIAAEEGAHAA